MNPSLLMIIFILIGSIYFILLDFLSFIFSITSLCGILSSTSSNFECGFYPILTSYLRYRFNYWLILIHFLISEQELILALLFLFGLNSNNLLCLLLGILFIDLLFQRGVINILILFLLVNFVLEKNHCEFVRSSTTWNTRRLLLHD